MKRAFLLATVAAMATMAMVGPARARDEIRIVGSSTIFPFTSTVIERFAQSTSYPAPIIESTGTGGGMRFFCAGVGEEHPDMTGASRPMKQSEFEMCVENGVTSITEIQIGYDGIALANSRDAERMDITKAQLFSALAAEIAVDGEIVENPYTRWSEIDPSLPDAEIEVLGPPPTSGTRDAFVELVMEAGCEKFEAIAALEESDGDRFDAVCATMREDGAFIEAGENDNLIVQRLQANPDAFGIFGYSFLAENAGVIQGSLLEGVAPSFDTIASGEYPVSRALFIYVKNSHVEVIPGMRAFIAEYTGDQAWGPEGYLVDAGLVPLSRADRAAARSAALDLRPMTRTVATE